jgi:hypothetical protein
VSDRFRALAIEVSETRQFEQPSVELRLKLTDEVPVDVTHLLRTFVHQAAGSSVDSRRAQVLECSVAGRERYYRIE